MTLKGLTRLAFIATLLILTQGIAYAAIPIPDGFDYPIGIPNGDGFQITGWTFLEDEYDDGTLFHPGEDWNFGSGDDDLGLPVHAIANGHVVASDNYGCGWGNIIVIEHKENSSGNSETVWSQYAHLQTRLVSNEEYVHRGQQIGTIGTAYYRPIRDGPCNEQFSPHLHFEIRRNNLAADAWVIGQNEAQILVNYFNPSVFIDTHRPQITPLIGDWDNNDIDTDGTFDPHTLNFLLDNGVNQPFSELGDFPIVGDWNRDGTDTIGVYRPRTAQFFLDNNNDGRADCGTYLNCDPDNPFFNFGDIGDYPLVGDWDGDGTDTIGVYRFETAQFFLDNDNDGDADDSFNYGDSNKNDFPIIGDWDNNRIDDVGVFRRLDEDPENPECDHQRNAVFYLRGVTEGCNGILFGNNEHIPITGKPNTDGLTRIGVYIPSTEEFAYRSEPVVPSIPPGNPNNPPNIPSTPVGPISGVTNSIFQYSYTTSSTDIDGDVIKYLFDWGDGTTIETTHYPSGSIVSGSHIWTNPGLYQVKVKAIDGSGLGSGWSETLSVWIITSDNVGGPDNFGYTFKDSNSIGGPNYDWIEISETGTEVLPNSDDSVTESIDLGFFFNFYGTDYSQLAIANNGLLFSAGTTWQYVNDPITQSPGVHGFIAPFWDDIVTYNPTGTIYYETRGTTPNRIFIVEWYDNQHYGSSDNGITFEAILYEGSNNIKFQYNDVDFGNVYNAVGGDNPPYANGGSATVGIEGPTGDDGLQYSFNEQAINPSLAILFKYPQFTGTNMYLSKQAPASKGHGSTMTYNLYYHNFGDTAAQDVVLEDTLPQEVEFISASDGGTYNSGTGKVTWNIGTIAPLGHNYRSVNVRISDSVVVGTVIQNNARIDTSTIEVRYDDNDANAQTRVTGSTLPPDVSVEPNYGGTGAPSVGLHRPITFSYNNPTAIGVDINIQFSDGSTESGIMAGGAPEWTYTTTFSRTGSTIVTYSIQRGSASYSTGYDVRNSDGDFITANDIETYIENNYPTSPMLDETNIGSSFINAGSTNGIDPAFLVATAELEGRFGTEGWALSHPEAHNTFGWGVPSESTPVNSINSADSWGDMVDRVAERIVNGPYYFNAGLYTVEQIRNVYAGDPNPQSIVNLMDQLYAFSQNVPSTVSFNIYIDPAGYIYDVDTGDRIEGATVWLQWSDGEGGWVNVPTNYFPNAIMQPDTNPLITEVDGMYQWDVLAGSYRVHVEATGYYPADSIVVSIPPPVFDLHVGLTRIPSPNQPPVADASGPYTGTEGQPIIFNCSASYDPDLGDSIVSYEWDFDNDGITDATGMETTWTWNDDYAGDVNLTVTDNHGENNTDTTDVIVLDITPPSSISNLSNIAGTTWITWNWTNPIDSDFNHTEIYLNGVLQTQTTNESFSANGLDPGAGYTLLTCTVDTSGNMGIWFGLSSTTSKPVNAVGSCRSCKNS